MELTIESQLHELLSHTQKVYSIKPLSALKPYDRNSNKHSRRQIQAIADAISMLGFNDPIQVDENNVILSGHGRYAASKLLELEHVPVLAIIGLTDDQKTAYRIAVNSLPRKSSFDNEILRLELQDLHMTDLQVPKMTGFSPEELESIGVNMHVDLDIDLNTEGKAKNPEKQLEKSARQLCQEDSRLKPELMSLAGYKSAVERTGTSSSVLWYQSAGLLVGDVLDYGCGQDTHPYAKFDPSYFSDYELLKKQWDVIMCNYVLNIIPLKHNRIELLQSLKPILKPDGLILVSIFNKTRKAHKIEKSGFQCAWKPDEWDHFFNEWFSSVVKLKATFNAWMLRV